MGFYQSIAQYYDLIFIDYLAKQKFTQLFLTKKADKMLDIGCSTGKLASLLASEQLGIEAIDLDGEMIEYASAKHANKHVNYQVMDMLAMGDNFSPASFDIITCYGNTLVHLDNYAEVDELLKQASKLLKKGGYFLIQMINYDRIIDEQVTSLPTIDNQNVRFVRDYQHLATEGKINFLTQLTIKSTNKVITNQVKLLTLHSLKLEEMLKNNNFCGVKMYADWQRKPACYDAVSLIISCQKRRIKMSENQ